LLSIQSESAIVELSNESTKFRFISLKSYYQNDDHTNDELSFSSASSLIESSIESSVESNVESQNNLTIESIILIASIKRDRDRLRKFFASIINFIFDIVKSVVLSFIASRQKEIVDLLEKEIFISINKKNVSADVRIFRSRFVNEIKHSDTEKAFEKFRLVIQTFNVQNKILVLI
jgi:hypothetical protein